MKVLIFSSFNFPPLFIGLNLEFIQKNIDEGNEVFLIDDNQHSFKECGFNPYKLKYMCEICKFRENRGLKLINGKFNRFSVNEIAVDRDRKLAKDFLEPLSRINKKTKYENFDVGESVYSSFISKTRDREFSSRSDQEILKKLVFNSIVTYESIKRLIRKENIEKLFLFNGRWDYYRAALAASRAEKIEIEVFENYRAGGYTENFGDHLPHNIQNKYRLIKEHWENADNPQEREKIADDWFEKKRQGKALNDKAYSKDQKKGKLPLGFDPEKKVFVLFNSSDDETAAVGKEYDNPFFTDQLEGIMYLVDYFKDKPDCQLFIRMHPNLKGLVKDYITPIYSIEGKYENIFLIRPEDDTDSYELMAVANTVISFGSTAGLEASYWGTPVILLAKGFYYYSDVAYIPASKEEIPVLLESDLPVKKKEEAQKFAYYFQSGGNKAVYYHNEMNKKFFFKGVSLNKLPLWFDLYYKGLKLFNIKN